MEDITLEELFLVGPPLLLKFLWVELVERGWGSSVFDKDEGLEFLNDEVDTVVVFSGNNRVYLISKSRFSYLSESDFRILDSIDQVKEVINILDKHG